MSGPRLTGRSTTAEQLVHIRELLMLGLTHVAVRVRTGASLGMIARVAREIRRDGETPNSGDDNEG